MPAPRPLPRLRAGLRPLDIKRLASRTAFLNAEDAAPAPSPDADLPVLTRWSLAPLGEVAQLLALDDWGHVVCLSVVAFASDGTWAQRVDGSYVRLADPWPLPLAPLPGATK